MIGLIGGDDAEEQPERLGYGLVIGLIGGDDSNDVYFPWGIA